jgi:hypothetical protein
MRMEQGSLTVNAITSTAWAQSTLYNAGDYVTTSNGKTLKCTTTGTSSATGTGPTGTCHGDQVLEIDGGARWIIWTGSTDALTRPGTSRSQWPTPGAGR